MGIDPRVSRLGGEIVSPNTTDARRSCSTSSAVIGSKAGRRWVCAAMKVGGTESLVASRIDSVFSRKNRRGHLVECWVRFLQVVLESSSVISRVSYRPLQHLQFFGGGEWNVCAGTAFFVTSLA